MLRYSGLTAVALVALFMTPAHAIDTIDCTARLNSAEKTICASQRLQILDAKITEVYAEFMLSKWMSPSAKASLLQSQRNFLARRDACGADYECLEDIMGLRATRINHYR